MKKILFSILAAAAVAVSCTKFAEDAPIVFTDAEAPEVTAKTTGDNQIYVTVTGKQSTSFFTYAVIEGKAEKIDSVALLKGSYASYAVKLDDEPVAEVVDFAETQIVKLSVTGLTSNTTYTVYAVASNAQGKVSPVVTASATTTDGTNPQLIYEKYQSAEKDSLLTFSVPFDDPVSVGKDAEVTAHFFARYGGTDAEGCFVEQKSVTIPEDCILADGNVLYVYVPEEEYVPGAYVSITYAEGTVENALGAGCVAFEDASVAYDSEAKEVVWNGICAQYKNVAFKLSLKPEGDDEADDDTPGKADDEEDEDEEGDEYEIFSDWESLVMKSYAQTKYPLAGRKKTTAVISVVDGDGRTVSYTGKQLAIVDNTEGIVGVALDEDPGFGTYVSYKIAAESILDIYGNTNEEFTVTKGYFCSYGYTLDDIIGTYIVAGTSYWSSYGLDETANWVIAKSDNAKKGNIMITTYWDYECDYPIYGTFDGDSGILYIPHYQIFKTVTDPDADGAKVGDLYFTCNTDSANAVLQIRVPAKGVLTGINMYFGYYCEAEDAYEKQGGWWNLFTAISGTRE